MMNPLMVHNILTAEWCKLVMWKELIDADRHFSVATIHHLMTELSVPE